jgi:hypothetical protein
MSSNYIESIVGDDGQILIEVREATSTVGFGAQPTEKSKEKARNAFNQALHTIQLAASGVLETLNTLPEKPDTAKVDFAIKFDAEARAMIAHSSNDAQLRVSLSWTTTKPKADKE